MSDEKRLAEMRETATELWSPDDVQFVVSLLDAAQTRLLQAERERDEMTCYRDILDGALLQVKAKFSAAEERGSQAERDMKEAFANAQKATDCLAETEAELRAAEERLSALAAAAKQREKTAFIEGHEAGYQNGLDVHWGWEKKNPEELWRAREALAQSEAPQNKDAPQTTHSHESGDKG